VSISLFYRYRENAQRLSRIFRDQPLTPLQQAVFWTEYVIRHKGAPHMRSAVLDLAWYQYFLLDVIAVLALAVGSVLVVAFLLLRALLRKLFGARRCVKKADKSAKKRD
jgi:glucuronosyltransferase